MEIILKKKYSNLARAFDTLEYIKFIMNQVLKGLSPEEIRRVFIEDNPFGIKTEKTRATFAQWLVKDYIKSYEPDELSVLARLITRETVPQQAKRELLFYTTCCVDELAGLMTTDLLYPAYQSGSANLQRDDLIRFVSQNTSLAESTIKRAVIGYIMLLEKLSVATHNSTNKLVLRYFAPRIESFAFILFRLYHRGIPPAQIIDSIDFRFLLMNPINILNFLKKLELQNLVTFAMAGDVIRLETKISFEELPDVLCR